MFNLTKPGNILGAVLGDTDIGTHINACVDLPGSPAGAAGAAGAAAAGHGSSSGGAVALGGGGGAGAAMRGAARPHLSPAAGYTSLDDDDTDL